MKIELNSTEFQLLTYCLSDILDVRNRLNLTVGWRSEWTKEKRICVGYSSLKSPITIEITDIKDGK